MLFLGGGGRNIGTFVPKCSKSSGEYLSCSNWKCRERREGRHALLQRTSSIGQRSIRARVEFQFEPPRNVSDYEYREIRRTNQKIRSNVLCNNAVLGLCTMITIEKTSWHDREIGVKLISQGNNRAKFSIVSSFSIFSNDIGNFLYSFFFFSSERIKMADNSKIILDRFL